MSILSAENHSHCYDRRQSPPEDFILLEKLMPDLQVDLKYSSDDNFIGRPLIGYQQARAMLTQQAAQTLKDIQSELRPLGLALKIFDAYRPQRTVDFFLHWADSAGDDMMKDTFYPALEKAELLQQGYLNSPSAHSRGSTVDLTIIRRSENSELDMGTPFDFFGPQSWTDFQGITATQRSNRAFLQKIMKTHGFTGVKEEWWHFTLKNEPYPHTCFDFLTRQS